MGDYGMDYTERGVKLIQLRINAIIKINYKRVLNYFYFIIYSLLNDINGIKQIKQS